MSYRLQKQINILKKEVAALKKERYTVENIKRDMHDIIVAVVQQNIEIEVTEQSTDEKIKELIDEDTNDGE